MAVRKRRALRWADMDKSEISLRLLIEQFDIHNRVEGQSPKTREWYNSSLGQLVAYLEAESMSAKLGEIDFRSVENFILYLQSKRKWDDLSWPKNHVRRKNSESAGIAPMGDRF